MDRARLCRSQIAASAVAVAILAAPSCRRVSTTATDSGGPRAATGWPAAADLVVDHVAVLPMDAEHVLLDRTVVVQGRRVASVGPASEAPAYPTAVHVDGKGRWLTPGLFDMHMHWMARPSDPTGDPRNADVEIARLAVRAGITSALALCASASQLQLRDEIARGKVVGPRLAVSNRCIDDRVLTAPQGEALVQQDHDAGFDFLKVYTNLSADGFAGVARAARAVHMPIVGHIPAAVGLRSAVSAGLDDVAHMEELLYAAPFSLQYAGDGGDAVQLDPAKIPEVTALLKTSGTFVTTTLAAYEGILDEVQDLDATLGEPCSVDTPPLVQTFYKWDAAHNTRTHRLGDPRSRERLQLGWGFARHLTKALYDGGVPLLAGTDAPTLPGVGSGCSLHHELALLVLAGLTPYDAMRTATALPGTFFAQKLGAPPSGTVEVGARADLLLLARNPLEDIHAVEEVIGVILNGRWLPGDR